MTLQPDPGEIPTKRDPLLRFTLSAVIVAGSFWLLIVGKGFLLPLVLAILIWYAIEALNGVWQRLPNQGKRLPEWSKSSLSVLFISVLLYGFFSLIASNVTQMAESAPEYQTRLTSLYESGVDKLGIKDRNLADAIMERIDLGATVTAIGAALGNTLSNSALIAMYVIFLLIEKRVFPRKFEALFPDTQRRNSVLAMLQRIDGKIKVYVGVKLLVSLITAVLSYVIMKIVGLDFAGFWAVLIFVFNFIPYVGSAAATVFPTLLALVQFETITQALIIGIVIGSIQLAVGNLIEPNLMGKSLNISALGVLVSLTLWGIIWGILGMFLSVPIAAIIMIVCAEFPSSRWLAILLSSDGSLTDEH